MARLIDRPVGHARAGFHVKNRVTEFLEARGLTTWVLALYAVAFALFVKLRSLVDVVGMPVRFAYAMRLDQLLGFGRDPVIWLQSYLHHSTGVGWFDYPLVAIWVTYFVVPPVMAVILWWRRSPAFLAYSAAIFGVLYLGVLVNLLLPTAPPWLAAHHGYLPEVQRTVPIVINSFVPGLFSTGSGIAANDVAAMPSLHMGAATVVAIYLPWRTYLGKLLAGAYAALMGVALLGLGEHYVSDVLGGFILALAVCWLVRLGFSRWGSPSGPDKTGIPTAVGTGIDITSDTGDGLSRSVQETLNVGSPGSQQAK